MMQSARLTHEINSLDLGAFSLTFWCRWADGSVRLSGELGGQMDQSGWRGLEAAGIDVECGQVVFEIDVQPLAASRHGVPGSMADKRGADTLPLMLTGDLGIREEGMITSIPCHVDEADDAAIVSAGGHPAQAAGPYLIPPTGYGTATMSFGECHHFGVGDRPAPAVINRLGHVPDSRPARSPRSTGQPRRSPCDQRVVECGCQMSAPVTHGRPDLRVRRFDQDAYGSLEPVARHCGWAGLPSMRLDSSAKRR
jgi:hypothetical protein